MVIFFMSKRYFRLEQHEEVNWKMLNSKCSKLSLDQPKRNEGDDRRMKAEWIQMMMQVLFLLASLVWGEQLPEFSELPPETLYPQGAKVTVAPDGHFLVNGIPRYLLGTIFYEGVAATFEQKTEGYPDTLAWLYEKPHGYQTHQRIGFDATGMSTSNAWIEKYRPGQRRSFAEMGEKILKTVIESGLPLYVDFTAARWHHGQLKHQEGLPPSREAFTVQGNGYHHWMYYNPNHPEGMQLYEDMWRHGVKYVLSLGAQPLIYELFNEPGLNDISTCSRDGFVERLKRRYATVQTLNTAWHTAYPDFESVGAFQKETENPALTVEWIKFMEWSFQEAVRRGVQVVREADPRPEALICVQPSKGNLSNVNQYEVNRLLNAVCTCTGGGNGVNAREYLSMAEGGRPIFDGETYLGRSAKSMRNSLITQYARGLNASFVFKWDRRPWDPLWKQQDGGRKLADKFTWMLLNPYYVKAEELNGIRQAKEEILLTSHLFAPRNRGVPAKVAILHSQPTRRLARATGVFTYHLYDDYALVADRLALPYDIVFEGQLSERSSRYEVLLVPGVSCVTVEARNELETYVRKGGTVVFVEEALQFDEYGFLNPGSTFPWIVPGKKLVSEAESFALGEYSLTGAIVRCPEFYEAEKWKVVCKGRFPAIWQRSLGAGRMLYLGLQMPDTSIADFLLWCIEGKTAHPTCWLTNEETGARSLDIEPHAASCGEEQGVILLNQSLSSKCIRFKPAVPCEGWGIPATKVRLLPDADGSLVLLLKQGDSVILTGGSKSTLSRYKWDTELPVAECRSRALAFLDEERALQKKQKKAFHCSMDYMKMLDLRDFANSCYTDDEAGDGKGGWTDQGKHCLRNVPLNVTECNGVPIDFIRPDMNHGLSCIVLGSRKLPNGAKEVRGLPVHTKAKRVFFLHSHAFGRDGEEAFRYLVHYANGSVMGIPIVCNQETGDWQRMDHGTASEFLVPGWSNNAGHGLWLYAWTNPNPDLEIVSLDIVSSWNDAIGLISGITIEKPDTTSWALPLSTSEARVWGGAKVSWNASNDSFEVPITPNCQDWCGLFIALTEPKEWMAVSGNSLSFELNGLPDEWGRHQGGQQGQVGLSLTDSNGKRIPSAKHRWEIEVDDDPASWQEVRLRLENLVPDNLPQGACLNGFYLQYMRMRDYKSGVAIRNLKVIP